MASDTTMGKLISFRPVQYTSHRKDYSRRARAHILIKEASDLLDELGDHERRISWLLSDCADLLVKSREPRSLLLTKPDNEY
jgi:hypothetical protein